MAAIDWSERPVAMVTGAASGIGAASARAIARRGGRVAVLDLDDRRGKTVAQELGGLYVRTDVTSGAEWDRAVDRVQSELGPVDIAHLNAGVMTRSPEADLGSASDLAAISEAVYRRIVGVNVDGVFFGLHSLLPEMTKRRRGRIVVTASVAGLTAAPPDPLYAMTKHALVGLVRSAAPVLAANGIALSVICPGGVDTPLLPSFVRALAPPLLASEDVADAVLKLFDSTTDANVFVLRAGRPEPEPFPPPSIDVIEK